MKRNTRKNLERSLAEATGALTTYHLNSRMRTYWRRRKMRAEKEMALLDTIHRGRRDQALDKFISPEERW